MVELDIPITYHERVKKPYIIMTVCAVGLVLIFFTFDPVTAPSFVLVLPFVLLATLLFTGISFLLGRKGVSSKKGRRIALLSTALPMIVLILQSIGQLTVRDVAAISAVFLLSYFYISRMTSAPAE